MNLLSRTSLIQEGVTFLAALIDKAHESDRTQKVKEKKRIRVPGIGKHLAEIAVPPAPKLERKQAEEHAEFRMCGWSSVQAPTDVNTLEALVSHMLTQESPETMLSAHAWISNDGSKLAEDVKMNANSLIVGVAVAAVVIALVFWVRRGNAARVGNRSLEPSPDFKALLEIAKSGNEAAGIAQKLQRQAKEPWSWSLQEGRHELPQHNDWYLLLAAFAEGGFGGVLGETWTAGKRVPKEAVPTPSNSEDVWVIAEECTGYRFGDRLVLPTEERYCTVDWWLLSHSGNVGDAILADLDTFIGGGSVRARSWRAPWGFTFPEDLRKRLGLAERELRQWRENLQCELNPYYDGQPERQLKLVGNAGEVFDLSMETGDDHSPHGDALVTEAVPRDGVPQQGLTCPGGSPLLLAVVRTKPAREG